MLVFLEKLFFNRGLTCDTILYNAPGDLKIHNAAQKIAIIALLPINVLKIVVQEVDIIFNYNFFALFLFSGKVPESTSKPYNMVSRSEKCL